MEVLLIDEDAYKPLRSCPLKRWQASYNKLKNLLSEDFTELFKRFQSYLPTLPYMYGLTKIHKENTPMRPITSTNNSVTYKLAQWLAKHLSRALERISSAHIKDTNQFIEKIRNENLQNKKMVSFDVESLFTKVPVHECINFLRNKIDTLDLDLPVPNNIFIDLVDLCISECYFSCNNRIYAQVSGLPMGSPLSPVLANLFMEFYETEILPNIVNFDMTMS